MIDVRFLGSDELQTWIDLRIKALSDSPHAFGDTADQAKLRTDAEWRESLLDRDGCLLIAHENEFAAGMARVSRLRETPNSVGLYSMWVARSSRRKGVGRALMEAALAWAEHENADEMILFVAHGNDEAKRLYLRTGFLETGTLRAMRSNPKVQMEEMRRRISKSSN